MSDVPSYIGHHPIFAGRREAGQPECPCPRLVRRPRLNWDLEISMNYCFHPAHTCAATQEGRDSARLGIDTFPAAVRVFAGIALLTGILAAQESVNAAGVRSQFNRD